MNTRAVEELDRGKISDEFAARNVGLAGIRQKEERTKAARNEEVPPSEEGEPEV